MLPRTLEPELMDEADEVREYEEMDNTEVNRRFAQDFYAETDGQTFSHILDLGTGPGLIPLEMNRQSPEVSITGIDLSPRMIERARELCKQACAPNLKYTVADVRSLPFEACSFSHVISNSIVHHLADPLPLFEEAIRVLKPGAMLFVRDLIRPETETEVESLVQLHAGQGSAFAQQLLRQSLHAAFTIDEVLEMISALPLEIEINQTSDRHWTLKAIRI